MLSLVLMLLLAPQETQDSLRQEIRTSLEVLTKAVPARPDDAEADDRPLEQCLAALLDHVDQAGDPALCRKAGFLALGYLLDEHDQLERAPGLSSLFQDLVPPPEHARLRAKGRSLTLGGRRDLAAHFFMGAALESMLGERGASTVGETKEMWDAARLATGQGTGFSFQDLCAHEAGIQFSKHLREHWRTLRTGKPLELADWMPAVDDLAEGLSTKQVQDQYGGTRGALFERKRESLRGRVLVCRGYRALRNRSDGAPSPPPSGRCP